MTVDQPACGAVFRPARSFDIVPVPKRGHRVIRHFLGAALLAAAMPATAQTAFTIDPGGAVPPTEIIARPRNPIVLLEARAPRAVTLQGDVDPGLARRAAVNPSLPLARGAVLIALDASSTYCTPASPRGLGTAGPCLVDADRNGTFDAILKVGFNAYDASTLLITSKGKIEGLKPGKPMPLPAPIPYARADYRAGQSAVVRLEWQSDYKADAPPHTVVRAQFWLDGSAKFTGQGVRSAPAQVTFAGRPVPVVVGNVTLTLLGFDPSGAIRVRIESVAPGRAVPFGFTPAPRIVYIGY